MLFTMRMSCTHAVFPLFFPPNFCWSRFLYVCQLFLLRRYFFLLFAFFTVPKKCCSQWECHVRTQFSLCFFLQIFAEVAFCTFASFFYWVTIFTVLFAFFTVPKKCYSQWESHVRTQSFLLAKVYPTLKFTHFFEDKVSTTTIWCINNLIWYSEFFFPLVLGKAVKRKKNSWWRTGFLSLLPSLSNFEFFSLPIIREIARGSDWKFYYLFVWKTSERKKIIQGLELDLHSLCRISSFFLFCSLQVPTRVTYKRCELTFRMHVCRCSLCHSSRSNQNLGRAGTTAASRVVFSRLMNGKKTRKLKG